MDRGTLGGAHGKHGKCHLSKGGCEGRNKTEMLAKWATDGDVTPYNPVVRVRL